MDFIKMHGIGNDYIYLDGFKMNIKDPSSLAKILSNRHFAIGSDGIIIIKPSKIADICMEMYNADGSYGNMCGNGARCVAKLAYDFGYVNSRTLTIESNAQIKKAEIIRLNDDGKAEQIRVNMGLAKLFSDIEEDIVVNKEHYTFIGVDVGNPHAVYEIKSYEELMNLDLHKIGYKFEHHPRFKNRVNSEFVYVKDENNIYIRVWERGSGETLACGTGAVAAAYASFLRHESIFDKGNKIKKVCVHLQGGTLNIDYDIDTNECYMTGPAAYSFFGTISDELQKQIKEL